MSKNLYYNPKATTPEREQIIQEKMLELTHDDRFTNELFVFRMNCQSLQDGFLPEETPWTLRDMVYRDMRGQKGEAWVTQYTQGIKGWLDKIQTDILGEESLASWMGTKAPSSIRAVIHE